VIASVEDVAQVVFGKQSHILLVRNAQAVKQIVGAGFAESSRVTEVGLPAVHIEVLLDCLNDVAVTLELKQLLGQHSIGVVNVLSNVKDLTLVDVQMGRVAVGALVVRDRPGGGGHHTEVGGAC